MDFEDMFKTMGVVLLMVIAYFALIGGWNTLYGQNVGNSTINTYNRVQTIANSTLFSLSTTASNNTLTPSGAGALSSAADLASRGLSVITILPQLIGLGPDMIRDFANILGIPDIYVNIGIWMVLFGFAMLTMYLVILGARKLL